jgi:hypothetical protein
VKSACFFAVFADEPLFEGEAFCGDAGGTDEKSEGASATGETRCFCIEVCPTTHGERGEAIELELAVEMIEGVVTFDLEVAA